MFGLPMWATAISAAILGGGLIWIFWKQLKAGQVAQKKADTLQSYVKGDQDAAATEQKISEAIKDTDKEIFDPLDWK